jgi:hypothetical protein
MMNYESWLSELPTEEVFFELVEARKDIQRIHNQLLQLEAEWTKRTKEGALPPSLSRASQVDFVDP